MANVRTFRSDGWGAESNWPADAAHLALHASADDPGDDVSCEVTPEPPRPTPPPIVYARSWFGDTFAEMWITFWFLAIFLPLGLVFAWELIGNPLWEAMR